MSAKEPTKRALLLRQRALRVMEKSLPEQIRTAYGTAPADLAEQPDDDPRRVEMRESARAWLIERGRLTREELDTLPVDDAIATALQRLREEAANLEEQSALQSTRDKAGSDIFTKAPRTLRQG
jgi:hypothetical protein